MRGYALLKRERGIGWIRNLKNNLVDCPVVFGTNPLLAFVYGRALSDGEIVLRQFILERYVGKKFYLSILHSIAVGGKPFVYPLPKELRRFLATNGVQLAALGSSLAWGKEVCLRYLNGIVVIFQLLRISVCNLRDGRQVPGRFVYFEALTSENVPKPLKTLKSFDICSWYVGWQERRCQLDAVCHGVQNSEPKMVDGVMVGFLPPPYQLIGKIFPIFRLAWWGWLAVLLAGIDLLRGRWGSALLLAEAAKLKAVQLCDQKHLALEYLFPYSGTIYRPLWTYEAERRGADISLYFYSTCEQPKVPDGYQSQRFDWGPSNWPRYIVWDVYQKQMLSRDLGQNLTTVVAGPIAFADSGLQMPSVPDGSIAIFDVQPHRKALAFGMSTLADYWSANPDIHAQFLTDVIRAITASHGTAVLKGKRNIGQRGEKKYDYLIKKLSESDGVMLLDPGVSAIRACAACRAGISFPFTSTALYLREMGLPSAYYDPSGWIQKDDLGAHGIPILSGKEELRAWVTSVLARSVAQEVVSGN